jgi:hypothetical protein
MPVTSVSSYSDQTNQYGNVSRQDTLPEPKRSSPDTSKKQLSAEQQREVEKLKKRDADVRAHEMAHVAAGGQYIRGGVSYQFQKGPDGVMYAVGGEVSIDTSPVSNDPQATITKMETVKRAALAPSDPSGADRAVAAAASQEEVKAQQETSQKSAGKTQEGKESGSPVRASRSDAAANPTLTYSAEGLKTVNVKQTPLHIDIMA